MNALISRLCAPRAPPAASPDAAAIRAYYAAAQEDYHRWSPGYNMHFGYWERGMSLFDREAMLERMNAVAIASLALPAEKASRVVDLGCGAGASARAIARRHPRAEVTGVTLVPEQIALGQRLNRAAGLARRVGFVLSDFAATWIGAASQDAALAIESFCHAPGVAKGPVIREAARLLAPGGRLAVVDGFLIAGEPRGLARWIYRGWCAGWAVAELAQLEPFLRELEAAGFEEIAVRDLSWRAVPCAAHIPWVAFTHMVRELVRGRGRLDAWRWRHIAASWLSLPLGLAGGTFRYCMVTARKRR